MTVRRTRPLLTALTAGLVLLTGASLAQLVDLDDAPNTAGYLFLRAASDSPYGGFEYWHATGHKPRMSGE